MSVHLIVDGYNLIRTSYALSRQEKKSLEEGRKALLARLAAYKKVRRLPITIVFDAGNGFHLSEKRENIEGLKVIYSASGQTADEVIARLARQKSEQAMVVTSDRELALLVESSGATAVNSEDFEDRMEMAFQLAISEIQPDEEDYVPTLSTRKKGPSRRRPKSDRRRSSRLKKI